jgi:exopolysaccharide production protein ExoZ
LRAIAALAVVAFHTERTGPIGQCGVDVFFVISGFIMWTVTTKPLDPGTFFWHRIIRIVPLYWIVTLMAAAYKNAEPWDVVRSMLFWPYRQAGSVFIQPVAVAGWTLNYEMFFYLLFAGALLLPRAYRLAGISLVIGGLGLAGAIVRPAGAVAASYTNPLMFEFMFGVWIAECGLVGLAPGGAIGAIALLAGFAALATTMGEDTPGLWRFAVWGVPAALIVGGAVTFEQRRGVFDLPLLRLLGDSSYSIYLFHPLIIKTIAKPLIAVPAPFAVPAITAVSALLGVLVYRTVEAPLTRWLRRYSGPGFTRASRQPGTAPARPRS